MTAIKLPLIVNLDHVFPMYADIVFPQTFIKKWRLPLRIVNDTPHLPVTLSCGGKKDNVSMAFNRKASRNRSVYMRASTAKKLGISQGGLYYIRYLAEDHQLQIGPVLGILTERIFPHEVTAPFGSMTRFYSECQQSAEMKGILMFVFAPEHINLRQTNINGWVYVGGKWKQTVCPFPDVIYNRMTSRRAERNPTLQKCLAWLKERHNIQLFNEQFLNKWQVHDALLNDPLIKNMLPHTVRYEKHAQIKDMLRLHPTVFIKPVNGSLGQGVIRLTKRDTGYDMQYTTLNGSITKRDLSFADIARQMARRRKQRPYIIQQGLPLVTARGRNVDFRALVQKNKFGRWSITSIVGRMAKETSIVSNSSRGGTIQTVTNTLQQVDPEQPKPTVKRLRQTALSVAEAFERQVTGHYAELGIDLAVDRRGKIWLLEINSKPSKTDEALINPDLNIRPSVHKTMDYTCFITGFSRPPTKTKVIP